jgi:hypothetical protein
MSKQYVNRDNPGAKKRILRVTIHRDVDGSPDLSWLGEYTNRPSEHSVDRQERGDIGRHEYRYFTPALTGEETGNADSPVQDYERMEAYNRGDWCMVGVWAEAEVQLGGTICQRIRSGGLWGIESDSGDYLDDVAKEELASLETELASVGFTPRQITKALEKAEVAP